MDMQQAGLVDFKLHFGARPSHDVAHRVKIAIEHVDFWFGSKQVLKGIDLAIYDREVTAFIGPSGCGKTTLLRCLNRSHDYEPTARMSGRITIDGQDVYAASIDPPVVRRRFGWVAQKPNPFPWSVYANVAYGPLLHGQVTGRSETDAVVETCLRQVGLWDEVKDRLHDSGTDLSGGQQQRLCIARAIAYRPEVLLMDEPASALDPVATAVLEDLIDDLRARYTIVIITHNMQQAARVSQRVAVLHLGNLVEQGNAAEVFTNPRHPLTQAYVTGRFG